MFEIILKFIFSTLQLFFGARRFAVVGSRVFEDIHSVDDEFLVSIRPACMLAVTSLVKAPTLSTVVLMKVDSVFSTT